MASLQIDPNVPELTPAQGLTGWHREFCVELLGDGGARIFVRSVEQSSLKATELQRAVFVSASESALHRPGRLRRSLETRPRDLGRHSATYPP